VFNVTVTRILDCIGLVVVMAVDDVETFVAQTNQYTQPFAICEKSVFCMLMEIFFRKGTDFYI
jgi:hypothetical protein